MKNTNSKITLFDYNKKLVEEWHPTKNGVLTPKDVTFKSSKKVWWKCQNGHEWQAVIAKRSNGTNCPYCSGNKVCEDNSLRNLYPVIAEEWNYEKNNDLTPNDVTAYSGKKVWWKCRIRGHRWQATIASRNEGRGCPKCYQIKHKPD